MIELFSFEEKVLCQLEVRSALVTWSGQITSWLLLFFRLRGARIQPLRSVQFKILWSALYSGAATAVETLLMRTILKVIASSAGIQRSMSCIIVLYMHIFCHIYKISNNGRSPCMDGSCPIQRARYVRIVLQQCKHVRRKDWTKVAVALCDRFCHMRL